MTDLIISRFLNKVDKPEIKSHPVPNNELVGFIDCVVVRLILSTTSSHIFGLLRDLLPEINRFKLFHTAGMFFKL